MDRFGFPNIVRDLNGANTHRLENVLTLNVEVHGKFDTLKLWFEPTVGNVSPIPSSLGLKSPEQSQHLHGPNPTYSLSWTLLQTYCDVHNSR